MQKATQAYFQTQLTTTSQGDLLVMLYDGAIAYLSEAKEKMAEKNFAEKGMLISKALDVISELDGSLNMEKGGELSKNLHNLYIYSQNKLLQANLRMNQEFVEEVIGILTSLRSAFAEIVHTPEAIKAQSQAPEQAPVNINAIRKSNDFDAFGQEKQIPAPNNRQSTGASTSTMARAYNQQASVFGQAATPAAANAPDATANANVPTAPAAPVAQVASAQSATATVAGQGPSQASNMAASQAPGQAAPSAPATATLATPAPTAASATPVSNGANISGFSRQMMGNNFYRKMAANAAG